MRKREIVKGECKERSEREEVKGWGEMEGVKKGGEFERVIIQFKHNYNMNIGKDFNQ